MADRHRPGRAHPEESPSLGAQLRAVLAGVVEILHTRIELVGVELEEEFARLAELAVSGIVAGVLLLAAIGCAVALVVVATPEGQRVLVLAVLTLLFAVGAGLLLVRLRRLTQREEPMFAASLTELKKDIDLLRSRDVSSNEESSAS